MNNQIDPKPELLPKYFAGEKSLERAYSFLKSQLEKALPDHKAREIKWLEWDNVYRLIDDKKPTDGGSAVIDPEPQIIVDVIKANITEAFFSNSPNFEYKGTEDSDEEQAEIMTAYRSDHLSRISLRDKFERTIHQGCVYGSMIIKTPHIKDTIKRKVKRSIPLRDANGKSIIDSRTGRKKYRVETKEVEFPKSDDTDWEYVSLYDLYWVGQGRDIQELEGVIHRVPSNWDKLQANRRRTEKVDGKDVEVGVYSGLEKLNPVNHSDFDLLEYWGRIPKWVVTGNEDDRCETFEGVITAVIDVDKTWEAMRTASHGDRTGEIGQTEEANQPGSSAIRLQENPFWHGERPFLSSPWKAIDNEFLGIGIIEPIVEKWHELNTTIRQIIDNKTLQLLNPTIEDANANVQREIKLVKFPRIKADDVNAVQPLRINDFSANGWRVVGSLKEDMRRISGAVEIIQGMPLKDERVSATEFQGTSQQAGVRLKNLIRAVDENLFKRFLDRAYQNDMQFTSTERIVKVVGKKGVRFQRVNPEDLYGTFDITTYGPLQFENKVLKANKLTNYFTIASKAPQFFNIPALAKKIYVQMEIGPEYEADEIVMSSEPESEEDIRDEITVLSMGERVRAKPSQDHARHIQMKMKASKSLAELGLMDEDAFRAFEDNVNEHIRYVERIQSTQQVSQGNPLAELAQNGVDQGIPNGQVPTINPMEQVGG